LIIPGEKVLVQYLGGSWCTLIIPGEKVLVLWWFQVLVPRSGPGEKVLVPKWCPQLTLGVTPLLPRYQCLSPWTLEDSDFCCV